MKKKIIMIIIAIIVLIAIAGIVYQLVFKNNDIPSNYIFLLLTVHLHHQLFHI